MHEVFSEIELLEFIEDELSPAQAAAIRERLSREPELLARLERMRQDRAVLSSDVEPALLFDIVTELEPLLAKPMLLGASPVTQVRPGVYRARHRRAFTRRWRSLAMAAGFVLVMGAAALWGIIELSARSNGRSSLAVNDADAGIPAFNETGPDGSDAPASEHGTIHHWLPSRDAVVLANAAPPRNSTEETSALTTITLRSGVEAVESPVVLLVAADVHDEILARLATTIDEDPAAAGAPTGALVRNFTYEEFEAAWRDMVASSGLPRQQELIASMDGANGFHAFSAQQRATAHQVARHTTASLGEHLAGDAGLAATADQQLRFVELGAGHAITLPAREVIALLEDLSMEFGEVIGLKTTGEPGSDPEASGADPLASWRAWRGAIDVLRSAVHARPSGAIVIPIASR